MIDRRELTLDNSNNLKSAKLSSSISQFYSIPSISTNITFANYVGNELSTSYSLNFTRFLFLKRIEIGNNCFQHVREFVIDGLPSLESVKIGEWCFRIDKEERNDGLCRITNCPNLRQLEIGDESFYDFKSFELSNLNSIQFIKFGEYCFRHADCSLKGEWKERKKEM